MKNISSFLDLYEGTNLSSITQLKVKKNPPSKEDGSRRKCVAGVFYIRK